MSPAAAKMMRVEASKRGVLTAVGDRPYRPLKDSPEWLATVDSMLESGHTVTIQLVDYSVPRDPDPIDARRRVRS